MIIKERWVEHKVEYSRNFAWTDDPNAGFGFPCDPEGNVNVDDLPPEGRANWEACLDGTHDVMDQGVRKWEWDCTHPAILQCDCGREVMLDGFTCPCECGRDYNMSGQSLAPRSQWGEETGETWSQIIQADADYQAWKEASPEERVRMEQEWGGGSYDFWYDV